MPMHTKARNDEGQPMQRGMRHAPPQSPSSLVAEQLRLEALAPAGTALRERFGQLGRTENLSRPVHRLSPRMGRRLRRRSVAVLAEVMRAKQAAAAKIAAKAHVAEKMKPDAQKERCHSLTKLGTQCRKTAVADGYCATHGG
jgi:hypothetical protein